MSRSGNGMSKTGNSIILKLLDVLNVILKSKFIYELNFDLKNVKTRNSKKFDFFMKKNTHLQ